MRNYLKIFPISFFFYISASPLQSADFTLKYATMAPQGSLWHKYADLIKQEIEKESGGKIAVKAYYGGIAGDEKTMGKKLKAGLIDIAAFSGIGLGEILPSVRLLELPNFFEDYGQVDKVTSGLNDYYLAEFKKEGLILGAWGEGGFVYLMSVPRMNEFMDLKNLKIWAPSGDLIVKTMFEKYGFVPVFLGMESVLTQLQTGGLTAVYAPPMAAVGLQWYNETRYLYNLKLTYSTGATLINESRFNKLPGGLKKVVLDAIRKYSRELVVALRAENNRTLEIFKKKGIEMVEFPQSDHDLMQRYSTEVQNELAGKLFPREILEKARKYKNGI